MASFVGFRKHECGILPSNFARSDFKFNPPVEIEMLKPAKIVQVVLAIVIVLAGIRLLFNLRERKVTFVAPERKEVALDPDYYVVPKKLHPQDLKDAKDLTKQPVWVREGYRSVYFPYGPPVDFAHEAGRLGPIEKLDIKDVVVQREPSTPGRQVMAVFEKEGRRYAFSIGTEENGNYQIYSDDILFIQDPHELYKHWPADVWKAIEEHQVKPGMNELQASFAIGVGVPEGTGASNPRIVDYPNNGRPIHVTFNNGKATEVKAGS